MGLFPKIIVYVSIVCMKKSFSMARNKSTVFFQIFCMLLLQSLNTTAYKPDKCEISTLGLEGYEAVTSVKNPYQIKLDVKTYSAKTAVKVTVETSNELPFTGIFLRAVAGDTNEAGTWQKLPDTVKGVACSRENDAVTHKSGDKVKSEVALEWLAGEDLGEVEFRATVVQDYLNFYEVKSEKIVFQEKKDATEANEETTESVASTKNLRLILLFTNFLVFLAFYNF